MQAVVRHTVSLGPAPYQQSLVIRWLRHRTHLFCLLICLLLKFWVPPAQFKEYVAGQILEPIARQGRELLTSLITFGMKVISDR